jgi:hypothetical protein
MKRTSASAALMSQNDPKRTSRGALTAVRNLLPLAFSCGRVHPDLSLGGCLCKCEKSRGGKLLDRSATFSVERT